MRFMIYFSILPIFVGCVSGSGNYQPEFAPSEVLERMSGHDETPQWASGETPFYRDKSDIIYVNALSMSGDSRPEACTKAAADVGRVQILREIRDNITASGQFNDVSASSDPAVETLIAFLSQGRLSGVKVVGRYWEKKEESDTSGMRVLRVHCAAKVAIARSLLDRQLRAAVSGSGGNPDIRKKLIDAQQTFLNSVEPVKRMDTGQSSEADLEDTKSATN